MARYTGLSLSFCVSDICKGKVNLVDVKKIVAGTCARTEAEWNMLIDSYCESYWAGFEQQARATVKGLRETGRIEQPRLHGEEPHNIADGHWIVTL